MPGLRPIVRLIALAYLRRALVEMGPLHKDVPFVLHRINKWERYE